MNPYATPDVPQDPNQEVTVPEAGLRKLLVQMLVRKGMFQHEAEIGAARLIEADLRGIHSHGSRAVHRYLEAMDDGGIDPRAQLLTTTETPAMAVIDAGKGLGHVAATRGMELAIAKAREAGTGTVIIRRSQHLGAAGLYAKLAADAGMIGCCTSNTGPATVAAFGSRQPATANNPLAWAAPARSGPQIVFDMACAAASWGKIESFQLYGQRMPDGWALDAEGSATVDPHAAKTLLPAAGARGYGLAIMAAVMSGLLAGGKWPLHKSGNVTTDGSEHFLLAIDIARFTDPERFHNELESALAEIRALPPAAGFDRVRLPGELEHERSEQWLRDGIPLHRDHVSNLRSLAEKMKLDVPWT